MEVGFDHARPAPWTENETSFRRRSFTDVTDESSRKTICAGSEERFRAPELAGRDHGDRPRRSYRSPSVEKVMATS